MGMQSSTSFSLVASDVLSYQEAQIVKKEEIWKSLKEITLQDAFSAWLATIPNDNTRRNYSSGISQLFQKKFFELDWTLQEFSFLNHNLKIDQIKQISNWSETTKQARVALYLSFTGFLERRTEGLVRKATPNKEGVHKTFFRVHDSVTTPAMNQQQWKAFLYELEQINSRDAMIAKLILQGGKRKSEVLGLTTDQIYWEKRQILFFQKKMKGKNKFTIITYPDHILQALRKYLNERVGLVFITRKGKQLAPTQIDRNFLLAGERANIPFRVTPHVLRATTVTYLKTQGFDDSDIMKITGHSSVAMLAMYDKRDKADNASKRISLV